MSTHRDQDDFLGWAPAEALEWHSETPTREHRPTAPVSPRTPQPAPIAAPQPRPGERPTATRQSVKPAAQAHRARQSVGAAEAWPGVAPTSANPGQHQRSGRPAAPLFGMATLVFGFLLLFTLMTFLGMVIGGADLGPVPFFTGIATLWVGRVAWGMRPRAAG